MTSKKLLEKLVDGNRSAKLAYELNKRNINTHYFAVAILEFPHVISSILSGQSPLSDPIARKCEVELKLPNGYFGYREPKYDGKCRKRDGTKPRPNRSVFKSRVFWDVDFDDIDWMEDRFVVIHRVYESGTKKEIAEINRFYGPHMTSEILKVARKQVPRTLIMKDGKWKYVENK